MTRITTTPKATSCPWIDPITGALEEMFGSRATKAAPTTIPQSEPSPATAAPMRMFSDRKTENSSGCA